MSEGRALRYERTGCAFVFSALSPTLFEKLCFFKKGCPLFSHFQEEYLRYYYTWLSMSFTNTMFADIDWEDPTLDEPLWDDNESQTTADAEPVIDVPSDGITHFEFRYDFQDSPNELHGVDYSSFQGVFDKFIGDLAARGIPSNSIAGIFATERIGDNCEPCKPHMHFHFFTTIKERPLTPQGKRYSSWKSFAEALVKTWARDGNPWHWKLHCSSFTYEAKLNDANEWFRYPLKHLESLGIHVYNAELFSKHYPDFNIEVQWLAAREQAKQKKRKRERAIEKLSKRSTYEQIVKHISGINPKPKDDFEIFKAIRDYLCEEDIPLDPNKLPIWIYSIKCKLNLISDMEQFLFLSK